MVEIERGNTRAIHLPEDHPVKVFCRDHGITAHKTQEALVNLIMESVRLAVEGMMTTAVQSLSKIEGAVGEELLAPLLTPSTRPLPTLEPLGRRCPGGGPCSGETEVVELADYVEDPEGRED